MKHRSLLFSLMGLIAVASSAWAQSTAFTYQGRLEIDGAPANGSYFFLFRLFDVPTGGSQLSFNLKPGTFVTNGLFTTTLDFGAFTAAPRYLQIEVGTNLASLVVLTSRQPITPTPLATFAATSGDVSSGATLHFGNTTRQMINLLGTTYGVGVQTDALYFRSVNDFAWYRGGVHNDAHFNSGGGITAMTLDGSVNGGRLSLWDELGNRSAFLGSAAPAGGFVQLYQANGNLGINLDGDSSGASGGGSLGVRSSDGSTAVFLSGNYSGGGGVYARNTNGNTRALLAGQSTGGGGGLFLYDANGTSTVELSGAENATTGSQLVMKQANGTTTIQLDAEAGAGGGGFLRLYKGDGTTGLTLQADAGGGSKVTTQVLQITGGSDLSEQFDINADQQALESGMVVSIDPKSPGDLVLSARAYDKRVAGIISGAGGVRPGMLMGQAGTRADGRHPVALSGRVYCWVDAGAGGAVEPGDFITTSSTPGHAMRASDHLQAQGAILGKAMSSLKQGRGLVLVLVSLQ